MNAIYKIINTKNNKFYIGRTSNYKSRIASHLSELRRNKHGNSYLQNAWNKYGEESFIFIVLESPNKNKLIEREQYWIDLQIDDWDLCYNISKKATDGGHIGIRKKFPDFTKNKNPNWKGGKTFCKCGNRISSYSKCCRKCENRKGINNSFSGKHHSNKTKDKLSKFRKGKYFGNQNTPVIIDDIEYISLSKAAKALGCTPSTIMNRVKSNSPKFSNYKYK